MMKNYVYVFFLIFSFVACSSDNDTPAPDPPPVPPPSVPLDPPPDPPVFPSLDNKSDTIIIKGIKYKVDSLSSQKIRQGLTYYFIQLKGENFPLVVHALALDREAPNLKVEAFIGNDSLRGRETPLSLANRKSGDNKQIVAAINGDFFDMSGETIGVPLGAEASLGVISKSPNSDWSLIYGTDKDNNSYMGSIGLDARITLPNASSVSFDAVNTTRLADYLVLFNSYHGAKTRTNEWGEELLLKPVAGDWESLGSYTNVKCIVEHKSTAGNMVIPKGKIVFSAHGTKRKDYTEKLNTGDEVVLNVRFSSAQSKLDLKNVTGVESLILVKKEVQNNVGSIATPREPRTAIGYSTEKDKTFFVVVEGRIARSKGLSTRELADVFLYLGATDGANLDGGGSSCMIVNGKVQNILADPNNVMRRVANCWTIASYN